MPDSENSKLTAGSARSRYLTGFRFPLAGMRHLAATPRLWSYVVVPVFLTMVMIGGAVWLAWTQGPVVLDHFWPRPGSGADWTAGSESALDTLVGFGRTGEWIWLLALLLTRILLMVVSSIGLYAMGAVVAVPFHDFLSQAVEESILGSRNEGFSWGLFLADMRMSLGHSLLSVCCYLGVMAPVLLLNLVPGVGAVAAAAIGGFVTAIFLAREMLDGPLSRDRLPFVTKLNVIRGNRSLMLGFGSAAAGMMLVPGLNLVSLPCAVVGGTLLYCELKRDGLLPEPRKRS